MQIFLKEKQKKKKKEEPICKPYYSNTISGKEARGSLR